MIEERYKLIHGDCLEVMKTLPDKSVDLCLTDPPYGTTACKWDSVIPFEPMWKELKRIVKPKAAICLFGVQPFSATLISSNVQMFKYELIWNKTRAHAFGLSKTRPLPSHENIMVFYREIPNYFPQMREGRSYVDKRSGKRESANGNPHKFGMKERIPIINEGVRYPLSILDFCKYNQEGQHPTQKPVELLRYLIRTYTQENETVLDFTMGSGSTGVACQRENRCFIGIEKEENYFEIAKSRIEAATKQASLFATV